VLILLPILGFPAKIISHVVAHCAGNYAKTRNAYALSRAGIDQQYALIGIGGTNASIHQ